MLNHGLKIYTAITDIGKDFPFFGFCSAHSNSPSKLLWTLRAILRAALFTISYASRIKRPAHNMVTNTRKIFYTTTTYKNHRVFLQLMSFAWNVCSNFNTIGQAYTRNFPQSRIGLLGSHRTYNSTDTTLL